MTYIYRKRYKARSPTNTSHSLVSLERLSHMNKKVGGRRKGGCKSPMKNTTATTEENNSFKVNTYLE